MQVSEGGSEGPTSQTSSQGPMGRPGLGIGGWCQVTPLTHTHYQEHKLSGMSPDFACHTPPSRAWQSGILPWASCSGHITAPGGRCFGQFWSHAGEGLQSSEGSMA